jgi:signal transduction histidine kinase
MRRNCVLVVDDKEDNLYLLRVLLEGHGYEVVSAVHGADALDTARRRPPDLVVADILMPVMDGFALCRAWMKDERLRSIPFIFYTATYTDERDREFGLSLGAEHFIVKPEEPEPLMAIIAEVVQRAGRPGGAQTLRNADRATRPAGEGSEVEESVQLKQYNEVLVRKLEKKVEQVERANCALEQDIVERKRVEEALRESEATAHRLADALVQRNAELEAIVYAASHDLRTPLINIQGYSRELLVIVERLVTAMGVSDSSLDGRLEPIALGQNEMRGALARIVASVAKMDALLSGMLRFCRAGRTVMIRTTLDMNALMSSVLKSFEQRLERAGIDRQVETLPDCRGDARQVAQLLSHLVDNAVKFMEPTRKGVIRIVGRTEGEMSVYCIQDNGIGIAMEHQRKIFDIFQCLHPGAGQGEGLGLPIVRRIAGRHGGRVWVESEPGQGSRFFVALPGA